MKPTQGVIFELMVEKVLELAELADSEGGTSPGHALCIQCLNHLKWCDDVQDPAQLLSLLLDATQVLPKSLQIELISALPGLSPEECQDDAVGRLVQLAEMTESLLPCVCEALSNMDLRPGSTLHANALAFGIDSLSTAPSVHLPAITRFLLETTDATSVRHVLKELRYKLGDYLKTTRHSLSSEDHTCHTLLLGIFNSCFQSRLILLPAYCSLMLDSDASPLDGSLREEQGETTRGGSSSNVDSTPPIYIVDLWIMFSLAGYHKLRVKILSVLCRKFLSGSFRDAVIDEALDGFCVPLETIFSSILSFSQSCLAAEKTGGVGGGLLPSDSVPVARALGRVCYACVYRHFRSAMHRQDIIAALVSHAVSPNSMEVDSALSVLEEISFREVQAILIEDSRASSAAGDNTMLCNFLPFVKTLLEDVSIYSNDQVRSIFRLLFQCSLCEGSRALVGLESKSKSSCSSISSARESSKSTLHQENAIYYPSPQDDILIMLRKYSTSVDSSLRQVAIIGSVAYLSQYRWIDKWQLKFGDSSIIQAHAGGVCSFTSSSTADLASSPYIAHFRLLFKLFSDSDSQFDCLLNELIASVKGGDLGVVDHTVRQTPLAVQSYLISFLFQEIQEILHQFIGFSHVELNDFTRLDIPRELQYDLNGTLQSTVYVKLLESSYWSYYMRRFLLGDRTLSSIIGVVSHSTQNSDLMDSLIKNRRRGLFSSLTSILNLACQCCKAKSGDLLQLGAVLGCPLELPKSNVLNEIESYDLDSRFIACDAMLLAVDWLRCILNSFCEEVGDRDYHKLIRRMNQLVESEEQLFVMLQRFPQFLEWKCPKVQLRYYNAHSGKVVGNKGSNPSCDASETPLLPTISSIASAVESMVKPLSPEVITLLGKNPITEEIVVTTDDSECNDMESGGKTFLLSQNQNSMGNFPSRVHKLRNQATQRLITHAADCFSSMLLDAERELSIASSSLNTEQSWRSLIQKAEKGGVFTAIYTLLAKALKNIARLRDGVADTLNESPSSHRADASLGDGMDTIEDINCNSFGSQFYSDAINTQEPARAGMVPQILRIIKVFLSTNALFTEVKHCMVNFPDMNVVPPTLLRVLLSISDGCSERMASNASAMVSMALIGLFDIFYGMCDVLSSLGGHENEIIPLVEIMELILKSRDYLFPDLITQSTCDSLLAPEQADDYEELRDLGKRLSLLCDSLLDAWGLRGEKRDSSLCTLKHISFLVKTHLKRSVDPMQRVKYYVGVICDFVEAAGDGKGSFPPNSMEDRYKLVNVKTLGSFYSPVMQALTHNFNSIILHLKGDSRTISIDRAALVSDDLCSNRPNLGESVHNIVLLFSKLVSITKFSCDGFISHSVSHIHYYVIPFQPYWLYRCCV